MYYDIPYVFPFSIFNSLINYTMVIIMNDCAKVVTKLCMDFELHVMFYNGM